MPALKAKGVDVVAVVSANDPFVLSGWSRILGFKESILALADPDAAWSAKLGLTVDLSGLGIGLGKRTTRYAIVIDDLKVAYLGVSACFLSELLEWMDVDRGLTSECSARSSLTRRRLPSRALTRSSLRSEGTTVDRHGRR